MPERMFRIVTPNAQTSLAGLAGFLTATSGTRNSVRGSIVFGDEI
ncbi:hypothetical protein FOXG_18818 [Fusarium oxysporum f. sp. lycopersici 4287]|uniref:Uncharacterized protein n=2 Tax=Fusarium oxysporum TaxID=5507 RepID=A0A0J9US00_FUSO4|nr:hypothetical protein FOXG_18818 [Fusarium oxysporum f. sp. lycopersici 4287]EXK43882.1 hypothetical protein FOMG_02770 [Fusarium oxysporum f. sp. melonis 26406]KNB01031.1 hypothetical protein FOXG_18818 [Fusarium oxysporum f. sp. lycopersici 4287]